MRDPISLVLTGDLARAEITQAWDRGDNTDDIARRIGWPEGRVETVVFQHVTAKHAKREGGPA